MPECTNDTCIYAHDTDEISCKDIASEGSLIVEARFYQVAEGYRLDYRINDGSDVWRVADIPPEFQMMIPAYMKMLLGGE